MTGNHIVHDSYEFRPATLENSLDIFKDEWVSTLPGYPSGGVSLFEDRRVAWAFEQAGGVAGKTVLELGPLEGGHTYMLSKAGAKDIISVEANSRCYLKCLITSQLYDLKNVKFLYGDFVGYLKSTTKKFDYIHAAGVLYHLVEPVEFLNMLCKASNMIYLWTHYADLTAMPESDPRYVAGIVQQEDHIFNGMTYKAYRRRYLGDPNSDHKFCGGIHLDPVWIEKSTILKILSSNEFSYQVEHDMPNHQNGPCCSILAKKA